MASTSGSELSEASLLFNIPPVDVQIGNADSTELDIDALLRQTLLDIEEVDAQLQGLQDRKKGLIKKYDQLKESKMQIKSKALANENWHEGKYMTI